MNARPHQLALGEGCQRWLQRRPRYRPPGEPFDPGRCEVALIDEGTAKPWVIEHHYSGSYPAARLRVGLFLKERHRREQLGGVAVFSVPMNQAVVPSYLGVPASAGVELGRFVLLDHELLAANAETWFLARAFRFARRELSASGIVAYCDPLPRVDDSGAVVKRGHTGTIYSAHNGRYAGRSSARTLTLLPTGQVISERTLSKLCALATWARPTPSACCSMAAAAVARSASRPARTCWTWLPQASCGASATPATSSSPGRSADRRGLLLTCIISRIISA